ncbi:MAG: tetratricopeptide repeat protein [Kiritimatiellae bacterium]|nr:tetratricopeptide repeat protein [Kiritimatiellia bacterium]
MRVKRTILPSIMNRTVLIICACVALGTGLCAEEEDRDQQARREKRRPSMFHSPKADSSAEQLKLADGLVQKKKIGAACRQYLALVHKWHSSPEAVKAQEAYARLLMVRQKYVRAFDEFQYLIDHFAGEFKYEEILGEQFKIARREMTRRRGKLMFLPGYTAPSYALDLFKQIIKNSPSGKLTPDAQFFVGVIYEDMKLSDEAARAYQTCYIRFPDSPLAVDANFRYAHSMYKIAAERPRDKFTCHGAFAELAGFVAVHPESAHRKTAETCMNRLKERLADMHYEVALFYDRPIYNPKSTLIAYGDFMRKFPVSGMAVEANRRIEEIEKDMEKRNDKS